MVGAVGMWETRRFSKGGGQRWETERSAQSVSDGGFPRLSMARHFHGARCAPVAWLRR